MLSPPEPPATLSAPSSAQITSPPPLPEMLSLPAKPRITSAPAVPTSVSLPAVPEIVGAAQLALPLPFFLPPPPPPLWPLLLIWVGAVAWLLAAFVSLALASVAEFEVEPGFFALTTIDTVTDLVASTWPRSQLTVLAVFEQLPAVVEDET